MRGRCFTVPDDLALIAAVSGALLELTKEYNWEQHGSMTPAQAADIMRAAWDEFVAGDCAGGTECPPVELPEGERIWRRNPTTRKYEYINEELGTWEFPDGNRVATLQTPEPRTEPEDSDKLCLAAANAAHTIETLWYTLLDLYTNNVEPALQWGAFATDVAAAIGGSFYPPIAAVGAIAGAALSLMTAAFDIITIDTWSEEFGEELKCTLHRQATLQPDGTVTFNHNAVILETNLKAWSNPDFMLMSMQVHYLLETIGEEGLNRAGGTTAITDADCTCGLWSRVWAHADMHEGPEWQKSFGIVNVSDDIEPQGVWPGQWAAVTCTITIPVGTTIREIALWNFYPSNAGYVQWGIVEGPTFWLHSGGPDDLPYGNLWAYGEGYYAIDAYKVWTVNKQGTGQPVTLTFFHRGQHNQGVLKGIRITGEGPCPFATGIIP